MDNGCKILIHVGGISSDNERSWFEKNASKSCDIMENLTYYMLKTGLVISVKNPFGLAFG